MNIIWEWAKENLDLDEMTRAKFEELSHEEWASKLLSHFLGTPYFGAMIKLLELDKHGEGITPERLPHLSEALQHCLKYLERNAHLIIINEENDIIRINYDNLLRLVGSK